MVGPMWNVVVNEPAVQALCHRGGPIEPELVRHGQATADAVRARAPIGRANANPPPGSLRDGITVRLGENLFGVFVMVVSTARNPRTGYSYGNAVNRREPFMDDSDFR